jgi:hypothetical protein
MSPKRIDVHHHFLTPEYIEELAKVGVEFVFDTTRAVASLISSGTLERYPNVSIILSHAGGAVPLFANRFIDRSQIVALVQEVQAGRAAVARDAREDAARRHRRCLRATPGPVLRHSPLGEPNGPERPATARASVACSPWH